MFVDDNNLTNSCKIEELPSMLQTLTEEMELVNNWMSANNVSLNVDKTQMLVIARPAKLK